jgi:glycosyltransferase involved in cell wall biosynthesis
MERWNVAESCSDPFMIYENARKAGMSHVAITDHNSIEACLLLKERFGDEIVTGVESTAYFPEDHCRVHGRLYGTDDRQFDEGQKLRRDIYELRDYLRQEGIAHSVAHATYSVEPGKLTVSHIERLLLLFNVFEVINGGRNKRDSTMWRHILENLTPDVIDTLVRRHAIEPFDGQPWVKGFTGGSDDHGGIFVGKTYTEAAASSARGLFDAMKSRETDAHGRYGDYQSMAFCVYKAIRDSSISTEHKASTLIGRLVDSLFEGKRIGLADRVRIGRLKTRAKRGADKSHAVFYDLAGRLGRKEYRTTGEAVAIACDCVNAYSDASIGRLFRSLGGVRGKLDLISVVQDIQASVPALFLQLPFLSTMCHLSQNANLVEQVARDLQTGRPREGNRILWFTDTLGDLNGVSVTLREVGRFAHERGLDVRIATSMDPSGLAGMPPNVLNLPFIHEFSLPYYDSYLLKVPSLLKSLEEIHRFDPDAIYISTPGPVGLLGLFAAKLMRVKSIGFYHTDFRLQAKEIVEDQSVSALLERFTRWFYSATDEIKVPTVRYMEILEDRGFDHKKLSLFRRGIDTDLFKPATGQARAHDEGRGRTDGETLLYVGRVSPDKALSFLVQVFASVLQKRPDSRLIIVGDGPSLDLLKKKTAGQPVIFMGRVAHEALPGIYSGADLFVFPSTTDTFGKAVLEAQACGLPAIVSNVGGPQEIVVHGKTGYVARAGNHVDWVEKIEHVLDAKDSSPHLYRRMREDARAHAVESYDNRGILESLLDYGDRVENDGKKKIA